MLSSSKVTVPNAILLAEVTEILQEGKDVILMTKGNSMLPFIRGEKDSVNLRKMDGVKVGDIVLAQVRKDVYVLHRVFAVDGQDVTLMGDGNIRGTEHCTLSDISGTAFEILKANGKTVDCRSERALRQARLWRGLLPFRRYILAIYRRIFLRR